MQCPVWGMAEVSVCLSVRHTAVLCQNDASWDHEVFTVSSVNDTNITLLDIIWSSILVQYYLSIRYHSYSIKMAVIIVREFAFHEFYKSEKFANFYEFKKKTNFIFFYTFEFWHIKVLHFLQCANWNFSDLLIQEIIHVGYQQSK